MTAMRMPAGQDRSVLAAIILTVIHVSLIWSFRFLPVVDYPVWLFEAKILRDLLSQLPEVQRFYEVILVPVPNLTFTVFTWILGSLISLEYAGKVFLSICAIGFPWGVWYSVRRLAPGTQPAAAYIGFPYALSYFLFSNQNYFLALTVFVWVVGYFLPGIENAGRRQWVVLSLGLVVVYFTHGFVFILVVLFFLGVVARTVRGAREMMLRFVLALVPAAACAVWYLATSHAPLRTVARWDLLSLARNLLKPLMPFVKSYGVDLSLPLTILNIAWLVVLAVILAQLVVRGWSHAQMDKRFLLVISFCMLMMFVLPDPTLGVVQPGARFGLPLIVLVVLGTARVNLHRVWKPLILVSSYLVVAYSTLYFQQFNRQAASLYSDLMNYIDFKRSYYVIGLDWPAASSAWNAGSPSVNGLSFVPLYCTIDRGGVSWIFETGIIRAKEEVHQEFPDLSGATIQEWYASIFHRVDRFRRYRSIAVVGGGVEARNGVSQLEELGFQTKLQRPVWTILESP